RWPAERPGARPWGARSPRRSPTRSRSVASPWRSASPWSPTPSRAPQGCSADTWKVSRSPGSCSPGRPATPSATPGRCSTWSRRRGRRRPCPGAGALRRPPRRTLPLPGCRFARERCWLSPLHTGPEQAGSLHPLLHRNVSALDGICFETVFTGQEPVLTDHRVDGESVLPAAAYLEMAWSAAGVALPAGERENGWRLRDVFWLRPLTGAEAERGVRLTFEAGPSGGAGFSVRSASPGGPDGTLVYCEGTVEVGVEAVAETLDLEALRAQCDGRHFEGARYYEIFAEMGIDYGPAH